MKYRVEYTRKVKGFENIGLTSVPMSLEADDPGIVLNGYRHFLNRRETRGGAITIYRDGNVISLNELFLDVTRLSS